MRLHINLSDRTIETEEIEGEALARAGRHYIVTTLLEVGVRGVPSYSEMGPKAFLGVRLHRLRPQAGDLCTEQQIVIARRPQADTAIQDASGTVGFLDSRGR